MNLVTHLLAGWEIGCRAHVSERDRNLIVFASVSPDIDGVGLLLDVGAIAFGYPPPGLYATFHHRIFHGLLGALLVCGIALWKSHRKVLVVALSALAFHLHLLFDVLGSAGPAPDDIWPISYLAPFSELGTIRWAGQWRLNGWQNLTFTAVLFAFTIRRAVREGVSPFVFLGARANAAFASLARRCCAALRRIG